MTSVIEIPQAQNPSFDEDTLVLVSVVFDYDSDPANPSFSIQDEDGNSYDLILAPKEYQSRSDRDLNNLAKFQRNADNDHTLTFLYPIEVSPKGFFEEGKYSAISGNTRTAIIYDRAAKNLEIAKALHSAEAGSQEWDKFLKKDQWIFEPFDLKVLSESKLSDPNFLLELSTAANQIEPATQLDKALMWHNAYTLNEQKYIREAEAKAEAKNATPKYRSVKFLRDATVASLGWYNDKKNNGQNKSNGYYFYEKLYQLMEDESYAFFIDAVRQDVLSAYNLAENIFPKYEKLVKRYNELQKAESEGLAALVTPTEVFNRLIALAKENASPRSLREVEDGEYQEVYKITPKIIETVFKSLNTEYEPVSNVQDGEQIDPLESGEVDPTGDTGATDQKVQDERKLEKERIASLPVDQVISELPTAVESVYSRLELFRTGTKLTPNLNGLIDELETVQSAYESEKIKVLNEKEQKDLRFMISSADLALRDQVEKLEKIAEVALNKLAKVREDIDAKLLKQKSDAEKDAATVERLKAERAEADQVSSDTDTLPDDF